MVWDFGAPLRVTGIHHTTIIHWIREPGCQIPDRSLFEEIPEIIDLDELQTFIGNKRNQLWIWTAVNHTQPGVLAWTIGDRSAETFKPLWRIVKSWHCFFYVTDCWRVYPIFIEDADQIVSKTYMTRVEGEKTRLRHPDSSTTSHNKSATSKSALDVEVFPTVIAALSETSNYSFTCLNHYPFSNA
ncbi:IS1 family transposase [Microcoleus sp. AR_TQ3_B6]|uniref:IS1 family transposase n=1 Tax=Microcoleus sp. AR_TQ3_B6 TaxID=3055284 RepID=UPI002FD288F1